MYETVKYWILILIWIDGAKWKVFRCSLALCQYIEKCRFADIGYSNDADLEVCAHSADEGLPFGFFNLLRRHGYIKTKNELWVVRGLLYSNCVCGIWDCCSSNLNNFWRLKRQQKIIEAQINARSQWK